MTASEESKVLAMDIQFDDGIKPGRFPILSWLTSRQAFWVLLAVCVACVFLSFATNSFATSNNIFNVTRNFTFVAVVALGMTIVIITGGIDLSVGSVLCLCSMILAVVMHAGYGIEVGIAAALGTALLIGAINGVLIAYLGMPPFVVTLGMLSIARSLAMVASNNTVVFQFGPDQDKLLFLGGGALLFGIANPVILHARACASDRLRAALHPLLPKCRRPFRPKQLHHQRPNLPRRLRPALEQPHISLRHHPIPQIRRPHKQRLASAIDNLFVLRVRKLCTPLRGPHQQKRRQS